MANLKLTDVEKTYGGTVTVLQGIDLDITEGELIVFVGPSGCGKSTLLRMIAGLEKITGGTLEIDGMVVNDVPPSQRGIAMVFQSYALYPHMTVYDNMAFALKIAGDDQGDHRQEGARGGGKAAADELPRPPAQGALRRSAAAGGHRPVHRARPEGLSSSTSRCRTSTPRCASQPGSRSRNSRNRCPNRR
jgi:alpha-glucoside transport system ATP-binding protein